MPHQAIAMGLKPIANRYRMESKTVSLLRLIRSIPHQAHAICEKNDTDHPDNNHRGDAVGVVNDHCAGVYQSYYPEDGQYSTESSFHVHNAVVFIDRCFFKKQIAHQ